MRRRKHQLTAVLALTLSACSGSDSAWTFDTPVIDLPAEFQLTSKPSALGRAVFPERRPDAVTVWESHRGGDVSQLRMARLRKSTSPEAVWAELSRLRTANQSWTFDGPNSRQVANRPAWDWSASIPSQDGGIWATAKTLVISYPDSTYVTTFWGQHPEWHDEARLDEVVASFRIPNARKPLPKHPLFVLLMLAIVGAIAWVKRPKHGPARAMPSREPVHSPDANPTMPTEPGRDPMVVER